MATFTLRAMTRCLILGLAMASTEVMAAAWPEVTPLEARFKVDLSLERIAIDVPLEDSEGRERYHFACRGGGDAFLGSLDGNWVPPLMCTLNEGTKALESSLLSEDDSASWFSRGMFNREELVGDCAQYPEFGLHRTFRLRGFRLILEAENVVVDKQGLAQSFVLLVSLRPDKTAHSGQAERPGFLDPRGQGRTCKVVLRGTEPRSCRKRDGSWGPCQD